MDINLLILTKEITNLVFTHTQVVCLGALSCAMIFVSSCHGDLTSSILQILIEKDAGGDLAKTHSRYLALALALLYLGKQDAIEATLEALKVITGPLGTFAITLLEICAYAGKLGEGEEFDKLLYPISNYHITI